MYARMTVLSNSPWGGSHEVQIRATCVPTKWTLVQQKKKKLNNVHAMYARMTVVSNTITRMYVPGKSLAGKCSILSQPSLLFIFRLPAC